MDVGYCRLVTISTDNTTETNEFRTGVGAVLEPGLVIYKIYMGYWFFGRPTAEELRQDLRAVIKKCRPDWDITAPERNAAWQQRRKEVFYPYGKTFAETIRKQE
jgi:hypothetical protein